MTPGEPCGPSSLLTYLRSIDKRRILVQCACGSPPKIVQRSNVARGATRSCGCRSSIGTKHGLTNEPAYRAWTNRIRCAGWSDPRRFVADLGDRPPGDVLVSDDALFCGSCEECAYLGVARSARWAPRSVAVAKGTSNATKDVRRVAVDGRMLTIREAARALGLHRNALYYRLAHGLPVTRGNEDSRQ